MSTELDWNELLLQDCTVFWLVRDILCVNFMHQTLAKTLRFDDLACFKLNRCNEHSR